MSKAEFTRVKNIHPQTWQAPEDTHSKHPGAISGGPINFKRPKLRRQGR